MHSHTSSPLTPMPLPMQCLPTKLSSNVKTATQKQKCILTSWEGHKGHRLNLLFGHKGSRQCTECVSTKGQDKHTCCLSRAQRAQTRSFLKKEMLAQRAWGKLLGSGAQGESDRRLPEKRCHHTLSQPLRVYQAQRAMKQQCGDGTMGLNATRLN